MRRSASSLPTQGSRAGRQDDCALSHMLDYGDYWGAAGELKAREGIMKFVAKSIALAALVLVTTVPSYAQPLRSTSIPSSLADDEKRLMPEVMNEFYGTFDREKACWISKHEDDGRQDTYCMKP